MYRNVASMLAWEEHGNYLDIVVELGVHVGEIFWQFTTTIGILEQDACGMQRAL